MKLQQTEKEIEMCILNYLDKAKVGFFYKTNTIGVFDPIRKVFRKPKNKYLINGVADITGIINGQFVAFEVKSEKGKQAPAQFEFQKNIEKQRGKYAVVRSIEEVKQFLRFWFPEIKIP